MSLRLLAAPPHAGIAAKWGNISPSALPRCAGTDAPFEQVPEWRPMERRAAVPVR